jgi:TfoX/Sxy family transcriptional regulator of competence genes
MAYNEKLADRVRESLASYRVVEKKMFRGLCFMVNKKMCICVSGDDLMCRIGPDIFSEAIERNGTRPMMRNGKPINGYLYVSEEGFKAKKDFDYWVTACLSFNKDAKASGKTKVKANPSTKLKAKKSGSPPAKKRRTGS